MKRALPTCESPDPLGTGDGTVSEEDVPPLVQARGNLNTNRSPLATKPLARIQEPVVDRARQNTAIEREGDLVGVLLVSRCASRRRI